MEFQIPKAAEGALAEFAKLSKEDVSQLVEAIRSSKPALTIDEFAARVASKSGLELQTTGRIISMFAGMYLARIDARKTLEEFTADLSGALKKRGDKELTPANWERFSADVRTVLACEESLGVTAKALDLLTDNEHGLHTSRIVTDARYIFAADPTERPKAAVIVHMLNLVYHEIDNMKEIYIAVDASDLKRLSSAIERAEAKEMNLRKVLKESGVDCLES